MVARTRKPSIGLGFIRCELYCKVRQNGFGLYSRDPNPLKRELTVMRAGVRTRPSWNF